MRLARLVAGSAYAGLRAAVPTHGPYLSERLDHCVGGGFRNGESGKVLPHGECPRTRDAAAYRFAPRGDCEIRSVDVAEGGISQTEFTNAYRKTYDELTGEAGGRAMV